MKKTMKQTMDNNGADGHVTFPVMLQIANPGACFLAAFMPALFALILASEAGAVIRGDLVFLLLVIPVLANMSINFLNDYFDYKRGNDRKDELLGADDAPLAYHEIKHPEPVLYAGVICFAAALLFGARVIQLSGMVPAVIGLVGAVILVAYSAGKVPVSYLPVGELVSGFTLGGLVPLGVYSGFTGRADLLVLWKCIPMMLVVAHFMLVNNTCDIERDTAAGRKTMPILAGRENARKVCVVLTIVWIAQLLIMTGISYPFGLPVILLMLLLCRKSFVGMCRSERVPSTRTKDVVFVAGAAFGVALGLPLAVLVHRLVLFFFHGL